MEVIQQQHEIPDFLTEDQMVAIADDLIKIIFSVKDITKVEESTPYEEEQEYASRLLFYISRYAVNGVNGLSINHEINARMNQTIVNAMVLSHFMDRPKEQQEIEKIHKFAEIVLNSFIGIFQQVFSMEVFADSKGMGRRVCDSVLVELAKQYEVEPETFMELLLFQQEGRPVEMAGQYLCGVDGYKKRVERENRERLFEETKTDPMHERIIMPINKEELVRYRLRRF